MREILFKDRFDAGTRLGMKLGDHFDLPSDAIALGLVRGGAVVAHALAKSARIAWDILIVRKIGAPEQPEYAIGAYAESGALLINQAACRQLEVSEDWITSAKQFARDKSDMLSRELRGDLNLPSLTGKTIVLTDDGMATGLSMFSAIAAMREAKVGRVIVAVPVLAPEALSKLDDMDVDHCYLACPSSFFAVGQFYADFSPVTTAEVGKLLASRSG